MAGSFPLLTDNHVRHSIINALRTKGWDVVRAVDQFGERNDDEELLAWAAANGRALATCNEPIHRIAGSGSTRAVLFRMVRWRLEPYREMTRILCSRKESGLRYDVEHRDHLRSIIACAGFVRWTRC